MRPPYSTSCLVHWVTCPLVNNVIASCSCAPSGALTQATSCCLIVVPQTVALTASLRHLPPLYAPPPPGDETLINSVAVGCAGEGNGGQRGVTSRRNVHQHGGGRAESWLGSRTVFREQDRGNIDKGAGSRHRIDQEKWKRQRAR